MCHVLTTVQKVSELVRIKDLVTRMALVNNSVAITVVDAGER